MSIVPPATRTVEPEATLEEAIAGMQSRPFKLPPSALPIDHDEPLAAKDLSPGGRLSLMQKDNTVESAPRKEPSREEPSGLTPSDVMFSSMFGGQRIPRATNDQAPAAEQDERQPSGFWATGMPARMVAPGSAMLRRFLQNGIAT